MKKNLYPAMLINHWALWLHQFNKISPSTYDFLFQQINRKLTLENRWYFMFCENKINYIYFRLIE